MFTSSYALFALVSAIVVIGLLTVSWATTNTGFVQLTKAGLRGTAAAPINTVVGLVDPCAAEIIAGSGGVRLDQLVDLATAGYAKNAGFSLALTASTPISVDVTNISGAATYSTGDNSFTTIYSMEFYNSGTQDITVGAAASHPFLMGLGGTTPTITVPAGSRLLVQSVAGWSPVSGTNSILEFNPGSAAATIGVVIGGA